MHEHGFVDSHILLHRGPPAYIIIIEVIGIRKNLVFEFFEILRLRHPVAVCGFFSHYEKKGFLLVTTIEPVERKITDDIRYITIVPDRILVHVDEIGLKIIALIRQYTPVIKSGRECLQMPFSNPGSLVIRCGQYFLDLLLTGIKETPRTIIP